MRHKGKIQFDSGAGTRGHLGLCRRFGDALESLRGAPIGDATTQGPLLFSMLERGTPSEKAAADGIPSFLIECLVFNAPDSCFNRAQGYVEDVRAVVVELWSITKPEGRWKELVEVNRRKSLFHGGQPWTRAQVHTFLTEAWGHLMHE